MMNEHECTKGEELENLETLMTEVRDLVKYVYVRNGGGAKVRYERADFEQRVYNSMSPYAYWKKAVSLAAQITIILGLVFALSKMGAM